MNIKKQKLFLIIVIYLIFVSLGLCDGLQGVAWPSIHTELGMPLDSAGILTTIMFCMSAISGIAVTKTIKRFGTGAVTLFCVATTGVALIGYSLAPSFFWIAASAIPLGLGQGGIDTGINAYVAQHYTARQMNWLHCFWGVGAAVSPVIMTQAILHLGGWRRGYSLIFVLQLVTMAVLSLSLVLGFWKPRSEIQPDKQENSCSSSGPGLYKKREQFLSVLIFFLYSGAECSLGLWLTSIMIEARHVSVSLAGYIVTAFYGSIMAGRFLSGIVVNKVGNMRMLRIGLTLGVIGAILLIFVQDYTFAIFGTALLGLGLAPVYPCLMHITPARFEKSVSSRLIGYQVSSAWVGGSVISAGIGVLLSRVSMELLFPITFVLIVIVFFINEILNGSCKRVLRK